MSNLNFALAAGAALLAPLAMTAAVSDSGTLPVIHVNTNTGEDVVKKEYYQATYYLDNNGIEGIESFGSEASPLATQIKGRGNYTWTGFDKKPYKLKLDKKTQLMGMDKNKHFALLAHADDNLGFMRNLTGFELSRRVGLAWTPMDAPVEFYLNGEYKGLYFMTQSIRVDETRVNITEQDDLATENVEGGWLLEIDNYDTDPHITVYTPDGYPIWFTYSSPEELSSQQENYLQQQMEALNNAIYASDMNSTEWENLIDIDAAARFYIVQELMDDCESYHGSCYLYKDLGDGAKWTFGPVWDFGNAFQRGDKNRFIWQDCMFKQVWIGELYKFPHFQARVKEIWKELCENGAFDGLYDYIRGYASNISYAARSDYELWNSKGHGDYGHENVAEFAERMVSYLQGSIDWLGEQWGARPVKDPETVDVFVRGYFNQWGTSSKMTHHDSGVYYITWPDISDGDEFKIASEDWRTIDYGAPSDNRQLELEKPFELSKEGSNICAPSYNAAKGYTLVFDPKNETLLLTKDFVPSSVTLPATSPKDETPEIYTVTGQRVPEMGDKGIYILRYSDRTVKVIR